MNEEMLNMTGSVPSDCSVSYRPPMNLFFVWWREMLATYRDIDSGWTACDGTGRSTALSNCVSSENASGNLRSA